MAATLLSVIAALVVYLSSLVSYWYTVLTTVPAQVSELLHPF